MARKRDDLVYWVLMERSYLFMWKAHSLYRTKKEAEAAKSLYGQHSPIGVKAHKVDRVELVR